MKAVYRTLVWTKQPDWSGLVGLWCDSGTNQPQLFVVACDFLKMCADAIF